MKQTSEQIIDDELERLKARYPPRPKPPPSRGGYRVRRRVTAGVIDYVVIGGACSLMSELLLEPAVREFLAPPPGAPGILVFVAAERWADVGAAAVLLFVMAVTEVLSSRSPGKWWTGLEVANTSGQRLNMGHRLLRHVLRWMPLYAMNTSHLLEAMEHSGVNVGIGWERWLVLGPLIAASIPIQVGWLGIFADDGKTLHDLLARTRVIDPATDELPAFPVVTPPVQEGNSV